MAISKKKKINKTRVAFILFGTIIPILGFLIFYVYTNFSAFVMAFTNKSGQLSFDNFVRFFKEIANSESDLRVAFRNTFITFGILLVTFPMKVLVSYFIYKKIPGHNFFRIVFFLPTLIFSVAVALIFERLVGVNGFIAEWIANVAGLDYTPELLSDSTFANYTIWAHMIWLGFPGDLIIWGGTFARIPEDVLESARIDGVTWWTEFTRIIVPMVWPTVALQMVLLTCGIFGSTGQVWLLTEGKYGTRTISSWMYENMVRNSGNAYTSNVFNYLSTVGFVLTVVSVVFSVAIRKWTDKAFQEVEF